VNPKKKTSVRKKLMKITHKSPMKQIYSKFRQVSQKSQKTNYMTKSLRKVNLNLLITTLSCQTRKMMMKMMINLRLKVNMQDIINRQLRVAACNGQSFVAKEASSTVAIGTQFVKTLSFRLAF